MKITEFLIYRLIAFYAAIRCFGDALNSPLLSWDFAISTLAGIIFTHWAFVSIGKVQSMLNSKLIEFKKKK
ncbi:MAG: hypothetical protein J6N21_22360 [Butyrivibrio sp.]|nr:hypothetical protein [Butyrivibrio sp.]